MFNYPSLKLIDVQYIFLRMGRRSDHSREELRSLALRAAEKIVEREGLRGLSTRRVASRIGYTVGTLYNLFEDLDDLVVQLNGRTLDDLGEALMAPLPAVPPEEVLLVMARRYSAFVHAQARRWNLLFEHTLPPGRDLPPWYNEKLGRLLGLVAKALAPFFDPGQEAARLEAARVLWASLHGICSLAAADKLPGEGSTEAMVQSLVANYLDGLRSSRRRAAEPRLRATRPKAIVPAE
jgi:AcrR family transcriptional regulator